MVEQDSLLRVQKVQTGLLITLLPGQSSIVSLSSIGETSVLEILMQRSPRGFETFSSNSKHRKRPPHLHELT